ncbi:hypothetical protein F511_34709 [Dorcoceras hygrometricum]|uniref:Uncharacterized protein n=1 Tax=Dorcoceras hygrometricum TaxID=472368 RepID=A0A2Z7B4B5_9LAMI|nr:hypothetical protein F511_34709 [Dorcoceras hygrometricum]
MKCYVFSSCIYLLRFSSCRILAFMNVLPVVVISKFDDFVISSFVERSAGNLIIPSADHSNDIVSLYTKISRCLPAFYELVTTQILLAEPLGSLAFKNGAGMTTGGGTAGET